MIQQAFYYDLRCRFRKTRPNQKRAAGVGNSPSLEAQITASEESGGFWSCFIASDDLSDMPCLLPMYSYLTDRACATGMYNCPLLFHPARSLRILIPCLQMILGSHMRSHRRVLGGAGRWCNLEEPRTIGHRTKKACIVLHTLGYMAKTAFSLSANCRVTGIPNTD